MSDRLKNQAHWEAVYSSKLPEQLSWHQTEPEPSLSWIRQLDLSTDSPCIDIGGGLSILTDRLLQAGFRALEVLDISQTALEHCQSRLGAGASNVRWHRQSVLEFEGLGRFELWHDRAVLHFLNEPADQQRYCQVLRQTLAPGGHALLSTFASDGPVTCSALPVTRYSAEALEALLGSDFALKRAERVIHQTPWGTEQAFQCALFERTINSI